MFFRLVSNVRFWDSAETCAGIETQFIAVHMSRQRDVTRCLHPFIGPARLHVYLQQLYAMRAMRAEMPSEIKKAMDKIEAKLKAVAQGLLLGHLRNLQLDVQQVLRYTVAAACFRRICWSLNDPHKPLLVLLPHDLQNVSPAILVIVRM